MSELEMKSEAETKDTDFIDELSDEALDRAEGEGEICFPCSGVCSCVRAGMFVPVIDC